MDFSVQLKAAFTASFVTFAVAVVLASTIAIESRRDLFKSVSQTISTLHAGSKTDMYFSDGDLHLEIEKSDHNLKASFLDFGEKECEGVLEIRNYLREKYGKIITSTEPSLEVCLNDHSNNDFLNFWGLNSPSKAHTSAVYEFNLPG